jgi:choline dehydrogenase-like flavoprotein
LHGNDGPLHVSNLQSDNPYQEIFLTAAKQAGFPICEDFNGASQEGLGIYQVTHYNGERCSAARAYLLRYLGKRKNLSVHTHSQVERILIDGRRATGVLYKQGGVQKTARARKEVILCAGAIVSPQLLMLSGIGPAKHLQEFAIPVLQDLPGVGQNLQDHPDFIFGYEADDTSLLGVSVAGSIKLIKEFGRYSKTRRGMFASNFAEAGGFLKNRFCITNPRCAIAFCCGFGG